MTTFAQLLRPSLLLPLATALPGLVGCGLIASPARADAAAPAPAPASASASASDRPDEVSLLIEQGRQALEKKKIAEAGQFFAEAEKKDGGTLRTKTWVIRAWMEDGRINDSLNAIDALDREGAQGPAMDYLYGMAFAAKARDYIATGTGGAAVQMSLDDAVRFLEKAIRADPALARDAYLPLAEAAWYARKLDVARPAAEKAVARAPEDYYAQFMLGRIALAQYGATRVTADKVAEADANWETARKSLARAAELLGKPESPELVDQLARVQVDLAHTYVWKEKLDDAQRAYADAIGWKPALVDLPQVRTLLGSERFLAALESAASAIQTHPLAEAPDVATVQWWLGWSRYEQKQYDKADAAFSEAVAKWPGYANSWYYIMLSRYHQRDYEGSAAALRRHFDTDPADLVASIGESPETNLRIVDFLVGWLGDKERFEEAAILSDVQTAVDPANSRYWNNSGLFWRDAGDALRKTDRPGAAAESLAAFEKSWKAYTKALELEPDNPAFLNDAAVILHYYLDREPERAKAMYERAAERAAIELERKDLAPEVRELYQTALRDSKNNLEKLARGDKRE
jgi:Tfp pilus assembly protein PilF